MAATANGLIPDVIWGAAAIGVEIGTDLRATYHLLETKKIPARKVGKVWTASRSRLRQFFQETVSEALSDANAS